MGIRPGFLGNCFNYKTVAASQTTAAICGEGGYIARVAVAPGSSAVGAWSLLDGSTTIYTAPALAGGDSRPYFVDFGIFATSATGFSITTGASVAVLVSGNFTPVEE